MHNQLSTMLELQDRMNCKVNAAWREQGFEWYRAIWIECAELMDHHGWKWWKKQAADSEQIKLEVVDIWHFGLSMLLLRPESSEQLFDSIAADFSHAAPNDLSLLDAVEAFAGETLATREFSVRRFKLLMDAAGISFEELYLAYVGKNTLNLFRQDNGYKDGSYRKTWDGREDNEHLVDITRELDVSSTSFSDDLYAGLQSRYESLAV